MSICSRRSAAARSTIFFSRLGSAFSNAAIQRPSICPSRFSEHLTLKHPIVSANMDTITRAGMAVVQAEEGGLGHHRPRLPWRRYRRAGARGGNRQAHAAWCDPRSLHRLAGRQPRRRRPDDAAIGRRHACRGRWSAQAEGTADGARRPVRRRRRRQVAERMTPLENLVVHWGPISLDEAEQVMIERKIKKLPLVDAQRRADRPDHGRKTSSSRSGCRWRPAMRQGRLRVGRRDRRQGRLSRARGRADQGRRRCARHRHRARAFRRDGQGASRRFARDSAISRCRRERGDRGGRAVSRGARRERHQGRHRPGRRLHDAAEHQLRRAATAGARGVPCGGGRQDSTASPMAASGATAPSSKRCCSAAIPSCWATRSPARPRRRAKRCINRWCLPESQKVVRVPFKVFRGMASIGAMVDRLDVEDADAVDVDTLGAEGLEVSVPAARFCAPAHRRHAEASLFVNQLRRRGGPERS